VPSAHLSVAPTPPSPGLVLPPPHNLQPATSSTQQVGLVLLVPPPLLSPALVASPVLASTSLAPHQSRLPPQPQHSPSPQRRTTMWPLTPPPPHSGSLPPHRSHSSLPLPLPPMPLQHSSLTLEIPISQDSQQDLSISDREAS